MGAGELGCRTQSKTKTEKIKGEGEMGWGRLRGERKARGFMVVSLLSDAVMICNSSPSGYYYDYFPFYMLNGTG
jgi:hypothetical protein